MLNYQIFFRKFGVRRKEQLLSPNFTSFSGLQLPVKSLLHYMPADETTVGPTITEPLVNGDWRYVYVGHVMELSAFEGSPRLVPVNYLGKIREYQHSNPQLMWLRKDPVMITDPKSLIVLTYGALEQNYVYRREVLASLYRWRNETTTIFNKVNEIAVNGLRQQFITIEMPEAIPSRSRFEIASKELTMTQLKYFKTPSLKMLLDFWTWLGEDRKGSVLSTLTPEGLAHLNVIFKHHDTCLILNLGMVNSWRKDITAEAGDVQGLSPEQIQKLFLKMAIELVSPDTGIPVVMNDSAKQELKALNKSRFDPVEAEEEVDEPEADLAPIDFSEIDSTLNLHDEIADTTDLVDEINLADTPSSVGETPVEEVIKPYVPPKDNLVDPIVTKAREAVEKGAASLAEFQRFQKLAMSYETIPNPFGEGTLKDLIKIKPEDVKITEPTPIVDIPTVLDKSMLHSTLIDFDSRYLKNVLHKDIAAFVMGLQKNGFAVTGFSVDEVEDVMNHFHRYTVNVAPVAGKASSFVMEIPVIDEEGAMLAGGVKYYLKKQHGELPIRKTSQSRVSLSSYYGKVFVDRSENVVNNYALWLTNQIRRIGLDNNDNRVTELRLSSNFNHRVILPRLYTLLSQNFSGFMINAVVDGSPTAMKFSFDYDNRNEIFADFKVKAVEGESSVLVGTFDHKFGKAAILMDSKGALAFYVPNTRMKPQPIPSLESLLDLPLEKAPVETAVLNVFGKSLPLGFVLGYKLGLPTLLATLGVKYRKVAAGKQMSMTPDEYRVRFKDESWIFSRNDKVASLLVSGFNVFHQSISNYKAAAFSKKDVYVNIVENSGLSGRYIREIDLMFDLFIDHITKELLVEMEEPTDMFNLLIRAVQLLLVDYYPDDGDKRFMRTKGYERIAGTVYAELVKAARYKLNNPSIVKSSLDINPNQIKLAILQDSSKEIVEEINPIHNLKMGETVTFGGTGGRSTKTMVKSTRSYHETDMGVMSEATVDSGNVGIIAYLSANPKFNNLRGTTDRFNMEEDGLASLLSTSALLSPAAENDD